MTEVEQAVQLGAEWLDKEMPGWEKRIDLEDLSLSHCTYCVLGQLYGNFWAIERRLPDTAPKDNCQQAVKRGFLLEDNDLTSYENLTQAWKDLITKHLKSKD